MLAAEAAQRPDLALASAMMNATESELAKRQSQAHMAEQACRRAAEQAQASARETAQKAQENVTKLCAESDALTAMLQSHAPHSEQVIDLITVTPGFENALAVALGEALTAALDHHRQYWRALDPMKDTPALPAGVAALAQYVKAPAALARCLSQIGLGRKCDNRPKPPRAICSPGQIIVSRDGWAWRWHGFTLDAASQNGNRHSRLQQRNRISRSARFDRRPASAEAQKTQAALDDSSAFLAQRQDEDRARTHALKAAFAALNDAHGVYAQQEKEATALTTKLAAVNEQLRQIHDDCTQTRDRAHMAEDELKNLPDLDAARATIVETRAHLAEGRARQGVAPTRARPLGA